MTLFAFSTAVPTTGHSPSVDYTTMQANNVSTAGLIAIDHIGFNSNGGGWHNQSTYPNLTVNPTTVAGQLALFSKVGAVTSELFMIRDGNAGTLTSLTSSKIGAPTVAQNGVTWLPGGILMQWGVRSIPAGSSSTGTVSFLPGFASTIFVVLVSLVSQVGGTVSSNDTIAVRQNSASTTGFSWDFNGNTGSYTFFNWIAIGI